MTRGTDGPGPRCPKCKANGDPGTLRVKGDGNWRFTQCTYCAEVWPSTDVRAVSRGEVDTALRVPTTGRRCNGCFASRDPHYHAGP